MAAQRLRVWHSRAVSWFTECSPKNYPKYTQFGELRLFPYQFLAVTDSTGSEPAEFVVRVIDTLAEECSQ